MASAVQSCRQEMESRFELDGAKSNFRGSTPDTRKGNHGTSSRPPPHLLNEFNLQRQMVGVVRVIFRRSSSSSGVTSSGSERAILRTTRCPTAGIFLNDSWTSSQSNRNWPEFLFALLGPTDNPGRPSELHVGGERHVGRELAWSTFPPTCSLRVWASEEECKPDARGTAF